MRAKREKIITACMAAVVFLAVAFLCKPVFYLNDDVAIRSILSGTYTGVADGHGVYMKYPLTGVLAMFYAVLGEIPWLELFFAGGLIWSVCEVSTGIKCEKKRMRWEFFPCVLFVLPMFFYMHYTVIAAVLAGTAVFLWSMGKKGIKPAVFWLLSWMVRSQVAYLALPFVGVAFLWKLLALEPGKRKDTLAGMGKTVLTAAAGLLLCAGINHMAYTEADWEEYLTYNEARTALFDYTNFHSTDYYEEHYEEYGLNETEFLLLDSYNTILDSDINTEKINEVAQQIRTEMEQSRSPIAWMKACVRQYYYHIRYSDNFYGALWILFFTVMVILTVLGRNWWGMILLLCLGGGRSLIWVYLLYQGRFPERIQISLYVIELLLLLGMLWNLPPSCKENLENLKQRAAEKWKLWTKVCGFGKTVFFLGCICILTGQLFSDNARRQEQEAVLQEWKELTAYCQQHQETLYLLDVFSAVEYGGLQYGKDASNLMLAGGWLTKSPLTAGKLENQEAADGGEALFAGGETVFLAEKGREVSWLETYLTDRFGECSLQVIEEISCSQDKVFVAYQVVR